jgi:hypothetical protein
MTRRVASIFRSNAAILEAIEDHGYGQRAKLLAQGDSWFAFPLPLLAGTRNLVDAISTRRRTVAIDLSAIGDTAENMATGDRYAQMRRILAGGGGEPPIPVAAILVSAGGNDLVDRIGDLVGTVTRAVRREARAAGGASAIPHVEAEAHRQVQAALASKAARDIYDDVIAHLQALIAARNGGPSAAAPVVLHGYCHLTPRDAPAVDFPIRIGPWIWKKLAPLGYSQARQQEIARNVIDEFNRRLGFLRDDASGIHVLDLRPLQADGALPMAKPTDLEATRWWHDEIHLNTLGWELVARRLFDPLLDELIP